MQSCFLYFFMEEYLVHHVHVDLTIKILISYRSNYTRVWAMYLYLSDRDGSLSLGCSVLLLLCDYEWNEAAFADKLGTLLLFSLFAWSSSVSLVLLHVVNVGAVLVWGLLSNRPLYYQSRFSLQHQWHLIVSCLEMFSHRFLQAELPLV